MPEKYCPRCQQTKPVSEFGKNKSYKDGLQYWCKQCKNSYLEKITPEKRKEYRTRFYENHPEQILKDKKRWQQHGRKITNLKFPKRGQQWIKQHPEYPKLHRKNNPSKYQQYRQNYRVAKTQNGGTFTAEQFEHVKAIFNFTCARCHKHESECGILSVDHVRPISKGGSNDISNVQPLCRSCNSAKKDKQIDYRNKHFFRQLFPQLSLLP